MKILTLQGQGCDYPGTSEAIQALLDAGLLQRIEWLQQFCPMINFGGTLSSDWVPESKFLVLGSDHSITTSVIETFSDRNIGVIHIDAHADLEDLGNGNQHGAVITELIDKLNVPAGNIVQIGIRDFSIRELARSGHIQSTFTSADVEWFGIRQVVTSACNWLEARVSRIYVTLDLDVITPEEFPAVNTPRKGGLSVAAVMAALAYLFSKASVVGGDVVEYNPRKDDAIRTCAHALFDLVASASGYYGYYSRGKQETAEPGLSADAEDSDG